MSIEKTIQSLSTLDLERNGFPELRGGNLGVRIAATEEERDAAQALRYRVFYEEMGARPDSRTARLRRDVDEFDEYADHLLVIDHAISSGAKGVVGTYRLMQGDAAKKLGRFYSSSEYDISPLTEFPGRLLEVGRSCVDREYRGRAAMQLLWRGIAPISSCTGLMCCSGAPACPAPTPTPCRMN